MVRLVARGLMVGTALLALSCGDTDDGGSCEAGPACGGAITGNWKVTSSCLTSDVTGMGDMNCPGIVSRLDDVSVSGTIAFNGDLTYQQSLTVAGVVRVTVPASCLTQNGVTLTCAQLQQALEATAADRGFASVSCSGSTDCTCIANQAPQLASQSGTYSTSGSTLTQTDAAGASDESPYCVKGSTLTLTATDDSLSGTLTLTKQ